MQLSIVIPVYKSFSILDELAKQIQEAANFVETFELILVNDCSPDKSWEKISQLTEEYSFIKGISLRKNSSQHNAIMAGLNHACGDVIVMMDDDLQHSPRHIQSLYKEIQKGSDVCYTKFTEKKHKLWKKLGSKFNDSVANLLLKKPKDLYLSSFKAISKAILPEIIAYDGPYPYIDGLILGVTQSITVIEIEHHERFDGSGNYNLISSLSLWLKMATSFSVFPLRMATYLGISISLISFLLGIYYILLSIFSNGLPPGWTTLIVVMLFLGGIQLISIGIIGEYVGRSYLKLNKKYQFVVKEIKSGSDEK